MKQQEQMDGIWLGFDIHSGPGPLPQPHRIVSWQESRFRNVRPEPPFHYGADALVGLSLIHLSEHLKNPFSTPKMNYSFASESWRALEPHQELFTRAQVRIKALREAFSKQPIPDTSVFERKFSEVLNFATGGDGFEFEPLCELLGAIDDLEETLKRPLLYSFQLKLSRETLSRLHYLHSLLFNLRALVVMDHNAHIQDPAHEALKVDSISDYLPKAEYVANDAALYWSYKKCRAEMPPSTQEKMNQAFWSYSHNACVLTENLPHGFTEKFKSSDLEEALYLVQMDWLLGTEAGLLFRLREELYGLEEGYSKVFYPELDGKPSHLGQKLSINCHITQDVIYPRSDAA